MYSDNLASGDTGELPSQLHRDVIRDILSKEPGRGYEQLLNALPAQNATAIRRVDGHNPVEELLDQENAAKGLLALCNRPELIKNKDFNDKQRPDKSVEVTAIEGLAYPAVVREKQHPPLSVESAKERITILFANLPVRSRRFGPSVSYDVYRYQVEQCFDYLADECCYLRRNS